jgi:hypothetical protein
MSKMFGFIGKMFASDENEENESVTDDSQITDHSMEIDHPSPSSVLASSQEMKVTLPELLVKALPDVDLNAPNVLMIGEQSSGKTRLIISLLFYFLIDDPSFTNDMGLLLLKLFKTGNQMVTRRPTTVRFVHRASRNSHHKNHSSSSTSSASPPSHEDASTSLPAGSSSTSSFSSSVESPSVLDLKLFYDNVIADYHEKPDEFTSLVEHLHDLAVASPNELFQKEITIQITAKNVPNIVFTDLPGLATEDRYFSDNSSQTLKEMITEKIQQPHNTLVIVEPQLKDDLNTSLVFPMLK